MAWDKTQTDLPCPICKLPNQPIRFGDYRERLDVTCRRCGRYVITDTAANTTIREGLAPRLSAWIRDRFESGVEIAEINSYTLRDIEATLPTYGVSDQLLLLLRALQRQTKFP